MKLEQIQLLKYPFLQKKNNQNGLKVLSNENEWIPVTLENIDDVIEQQLKPALRPYSELTDDFMELYRLDEKTKSELQIIRDTKQLKNISLKTAQFLLDCFFDVEGLLDKGLAVPLEDAGSL
jgi:hypothetical protein